MLILRLRSWQLFIGLVSVFVLSTYFSNGGFIEQLLSVVLPSLCLFGWFLVLGTNLNDEFDDRNKKSDVFFIVNFFYCILFIALIKIIGFENQNSDEHQNSSVMVFLGLYFIFAWMYLLYFTTTTILKHPNLDFDYLGNRKAEIVFLSLFIPFLGIWVIQPRIRNYYLQ